MKGGKPWLDQYREFLRDHGPELHKAYDARFAGSIGDVYRFLGENEALAVFLALDFDSIPIGLLHYLTLSRDLLNKAEQRLFAFFDWRPPPSWPDSGPQGSPISISLAGFVAGWRKCQERTRQARDALARASNKTEFVDAFNDLARRRLLAFCTVSGHRATLLQRLIWRSLYQYDALVHIFDKDVDVYQSDRCVPAHRWLDQVLATWQGDLALMRRQAVLLGLNLENAGPEAVPAMGPDEPVFFELCSAAGEDRALVQAAELKSGNLEVEAGACFERPASRRSRLRIAGLEPAASPNDQLGRALRQGNPRQVERDAGPLQDVASALRGVSKIQYPIGLELQRANDWEAALKGIDLKDDLRAQALKRIHEAEINLWRELSGAADETSTLAGHLSELKTAFKLLSPRDDIAEFDELDWREWIDAAKQAVDRKGRKTKAVKRNLVRHFGLKRLVRIARRLGMVGSLGSLR